MSDTLNLVVISITSKGVIVVADVDRQWSSLPLFDPDGGTVVVEPDRPEPDFWVGAPSVVYDGRRERFVMAYRVRHPIGRGRGIACRIAESTDGVNFQSLTEISADELRSASIERSALQIAPSGTWRLYCSYVDPADRRWRIDLLEAEDPSALCVADRRPALTAAEFNLEGVKDPFVFMVGPVTYIMVNFVDRPDFPISADEMHGTENAFATGRLRSKTGLAYSVDGVHFRWAGTLLEPGSGWDYLLARGSTIIPRDGVYWMLFDGRSHNGETYQDRAGLAVSHDLKHFTTVDADGPRLWSQHGSGSLRYIDAVVRGSTIHYFYEYARDDRAHELRHSAVEMA